MRPRRLLAATGQRQRLRRPVVAKQSFLRFQTEPDSIPDGGKHELEGVTLRGEDVPVVRQRRRGKTLVVFILHLLIQLQVVGLGVSKASNPKTETLNITSKRAKKN